MSECGSDGSEGGVILDPPSKRQKLPKKETRKQNGAQRWPFTYNNYPENWSALMAPGLQGCKWVAGYEVGDSGTPHLQGYVEFPVKVRPIGYKGFPKEIHWGDDKGKPAKGTRDDNVNYCLKDGNPAGGNLKKKICMDMTDDYVIKLEDMYPWGRELVERVADCLPDKLDRTIIWIWSTEGKMKKTETARYLAHYHDACVIQGGRRHVLANAYKRPAPIYMLLVPRTDEGFVSYASIELLKDGLYMSAFGTEATGSVNRKKPWVIIFANFPPDRSAMSEDRWEVINVDEPEELYPSTY